MSLTASPRVFDLNPYVQSDVQQHALGALGEDKYGDLFRYIKVGASNITSGKLSVAPAPKTNHHNCALAAAAAINASQLTITLGATAATANEYANGYVVFNDVAPEGVTYRIKSHPAAGSGESLTVTLERPIVEAATTSSEVSLIHNHYNAVVEAAVEERKPVGIPQVDMTAAYFGWVKTRGVSAALAGGAISLGSSVTPHASVAGAVQEAQQFVQATDASRLDFYWILGRAIVAGVDTEYRPIMLQID